MVERRLCLHLCSIRNTVMYTCSTGVIPIQSVAEACRRFVTLCYSASRGILCPCSEKVLICLERVVGLLLLDSADVGGVDLIPSGHVLLHA